MWHRNRHDEPLVSAATFGTPVAEPNIICDGRFELEDRILGTHTEGLWRAFDTRLNRQVSVRLIPPDNPKADELRNAACAAARVVDTRVARVLDVLDSEGTLVIVTEWIDGVPLEQLLKTTDFPVDRSVRLMRDVASTLAAMHEIGATHGRLRPASIMITPEGDFRLRGHSIDVAIWGVSPGTDTRKADISGIGSLLTACLTRRWPGETTSELERTPTLGGTLALPSQLQADIPTELDKIIVRAMGAVPSPRTVPTQRPYHHAEQVYAELAHFVDTTEQPPTVPVAPPARHPVDSATFMKRSGLIAVLAAVAIVMLFVSARIFIEDPAASAAASRDAITRASATAPTAPTIPLLPPTDTAVVSEYRIPILRAREVTHGQLSQPPRSARAAIDTDLATSWDVVYRKSAVDPANASGVVIDLGTPRPVRAMTLGLLGNNTDLTIYVANRLTPDLRTFRKVTEVVSAPGLLTLRQPRPVNGRYFYIALTGLPKQERSYRGGISTIAVFGG